MSMSKISYIRIDHHVWWWRGDELWLSGVSVDFLDYRAAENLRSAGIDHWKTVKVDNHPSEPLAALGEVYCQVVHKITQRFGPIENIGHLLAGMLFKLPIKARQDEFRSKFEVDDTNFTLPDSVVLKAQDIRDLEALCCAKLLELGQTERKTETTKRPYKIGYDHDLESDAPDVHPRWLQKKMARVFRNFFKKAGGEYECVDNFRYARVGYQAEMNEYISDKNNGCCGSYDCEITITHPYSGEKCLVLWGFNYGH